MEFSSAIFGCCWHLPSLLAVSPNFQLCNFLLCSGCLSISLSLYLSISSLLFPPYPLKRVNGHWKPFYLSIEWIGNSIWGWKKFKNSKMRSFKAQKKTFSGPFTTLMTHLETRRFLLMIYFLSAWWFLALVKKTPLRMKKKTSQHLKGYGTFFFFMVTFFPHDDVRL